MPSVVTVRRFNLLFATSQPLADDAAAAQSRKHVLEACHLVSHINSLADTLAFQKLPHKPQNLPPNGHLLPSRSPRRFDLHGQFCDDIHMLLG